MSPLTLTLIAFGLGLIGWLAGRAKAWSFQQDTDPKLLAARPSYHGWYVALWVLLPVTLFAVIWSIISPQLILQSVLASDAGQQLPEFGFERQALLSEARSVASGQAAAFFNPDAEPLVEHSCGSNLISRPAPGLSELSWPFYWSHRSSPY